MGQKSKCGLTGPLAQCALAGSGVSHGFRPLRACPGRTCFCLTDMAAGGIRSSQTVGLRASVIDWLWLPHFLVMGPLQRAAHNMAAQFISWSMGEERVKETDITVFLIIL